MRDKLYDLLPWLLGCCIAVVLIKSFSSSQTKFEEAALGEETSSYMATEGGYPIHAGGIKKSTDSLLLSGWEKRGKKPVIFFLGNSQTHGVNRMKADDVNVIKMLHDRNASSGTDVMANSIPNGNLQEFYLLYAHYAERLPVKALFVPVFMDDLRETGIREFFFSDLVEIPTSILEDSSDISGKVRAGITALQQEESATGDMAALDQTVQASSEAYLNESLNHNWPAWGQREQIRGNIFMSLYQLRNTAFQITPQTKRKMVKGTYNDNLNALDALLRFAQQEGTRVVVYIPPLRNDVEPPYAVQEYEAFKKEVNEICGRNKAEFVNLENTVPGPQWGMKASTNTSGKPEYDFMHFTAEGHRLLAEALFPLLKPDASK
jgi:hypothetical protein